MSALDELDRAQLQREITNLRDELLRVLESDLEERMARVVAEGHGGMLALVWKELARHDFRPLIADEVRAASPPWPRTPSASCCSALKEHAGSLFVDSVETVLPELVDKAVARDLLIRAQELARPQGVRPPPTVQVPRWDASTRDAWRELADALDAALQDGKLTPSRCEAVMLRAARALRQAAEYRP